MENESTETTVAPETITKKDPKKVEQGKRLASISKAAKERKMRERIENEMRSEESYTSLISRAPKTLLVGIPLVGGYLIYRYFTRREVGPAETSEATEPEEEIKKVKKKFETLE